MLPGCRARLFLRTRKGRPSEGGIAGDDSRPGGGCGLGCSRRGRRDGDAILGTNVLVVMNPSKRAIKTEVRHVKEISARSRPSRGCGSSASTSSARAMTALRRPAVRDDADARRHAPMLKPLDPCSETKGTDYQRSACKKKHEKTRAENAEIAKNRSLLARWRTG